MIAAKKVEIIIESIKTKKILEILKKLGINSYTILQEVKGSGVHGKCDAQELTDVFKNTYFIIICTQDKAAEIAQEIRSFLKKYGGICYMSDVNYVDI